MSYRIRFAKGPFPLVTAGMIAICVVVFLAANSEPRTAGYAPDLWWAPSEPAIYSGAYWALVTSAFVHVEPLHLLFNMYWLWIIGAAFERTFGAWRYVLFVICAAFVSSGLQLASGSDGIGMSGVGYALVGFGWFARTRYPEFIPVVTDRVVRIFIAWGLLCVVLTYSHLLEIGNFAHFGGFVFGAAAGGACAHPKDRAAFGATIVLAAAVATASLFYNPLSLQWVEFQANKATNAKNYTTAIAWYRRSERMGAEPSWVWANLAAIYGYRRDPEYKEAVRRLSEIAPRKAKEIVRRYGKP